MGRGVLKAFYLRSTIKVEQKSDMLSTYGTTAGPTKETGLVSSAETF